MRWPAFVVVRCLFCIFAGATAAQPAFAGARIALVIGNAHYQHANELPNPVNDASLLAEVLKAQGFTVTRVVDATQQTMKRAFSDFAGKLQAAGRDAIAFIYYAGHGVQSRGVNYLIPIDARVDNEAQLDLEAVSTENIMQAIGAAGSTLNIVILDACRNNPFRSFRALSRGLAAIDAPQGTLVAFLTAPGQAARDGPAGGNSPYSGALSDLLRQPGLRIEDVFKRVRQRVNRETSGEQTPWESPLSSETSTLPARREQNRPLCRSTLFQPTTRQPPAFRSLLVPPFNITTFGILGHPTIGSL